MRLTTQISSTLQMIYNISMSNKLAKIPVPLLAVMVGASTLSNVFLAAGFPFVKHFTIFLCVLTVIVYIAKFIVSTKHCIEEYKKPILCSLYGAFSMLLMILGSYFYDMGFYAGKVVWFIAVAIHIVHILVFTYLHVLRGVEIATFVPSWFVTYDGLLVSAVVGVSMNQNKLLTLIVWYGILIYAIILPFMVYRIIRHEMHDTAYHTLAVVLAPPSLCVVGYLNVNKDPNPFVLWILYGAVLISLGFIIFKLPRFFSYQFNPGFAGMTFPMAIGTVASSKVSKYAFSIGLDLIGTITNEIEGIQLYLTTGIVAFVIYNYLRLLYGIVVEKS